MWPSVRASLAAQPISLRRIKHAEIISRLPGGCIGSNCPKINVRNAAEDPSAQIIVHEIPLTAPLQKSLETLMAERGSRGAQTTLPPRGRACPRLLACRCRAPASLPLSRLQFRPLFRRNRAELFSVPTPEFARSSRSSRPWLCCVLGSPCIFALSSFGRRSAPCPSDWRRSRSGSALVSLSVKRPCCLLPHSDGRLPIAWFRFSRLDLPNRLFSLGLSFPPAPIFRRVKALCDDIARRTTGSSIGVEAIEIDRKS